MGFIAPYIAVGCPKNVHFKDLFIEILCVSLSFETTGNVNRKEC